MRIQLTVKDFAIIGLAVAVVVLLSLNRCNYRKATFYQQATEAMADSLHTQRNQQGQHIATIKALEADNSRQLLKLETQDREIVKLQELIKKAPARTVSATVATTETNAQGQTPTKVSYTTLEPKRPLLKPENWPVYSTTITGPWINGSIRATHDSITYALQFVNDFEITHRRSPWNPFKRPAITVTVLSKNPYTSTTSLRSAIVRSGQKRYGLSIYAGYGMTATLTGQLFHGVQIGAGFAYQIWP